MNDKINNETLEQSRCSVLTSIELLCCPFCGGTANFFADSVKFQGISHRVWYVACDNESDCTIRTPRTMIYEDKRLAARAWNDREAI